MAMFTLGPEDALSYSYDPPQDSGRTFVFVNALTGSAGMWQTAIVPRLQAAGHGTLAYDFRGQAQSRFASGTPLTPDLVVDDLKRLLAEVAAPRPVLVGLSIGGLFAARAWLAGAEAEALVLINTLRRPSLKLAWINEATFRAARTGGLALMMDLYLPLLVGEEALAALRPERLGEEPYEPLPPDHGLYQLMAHAGDADWDLPYERLSLPVLILSGLQDRVFYDAGDVAALTARLPAARSRVFEDAGHLIPMERPGETATALIDFAEELDSGC